MVNRLQGLGDRIIGRFVPQVTAEAGVQDYTVYCGCWSIAKMDAPGYRVFRKNCVAGGGCGSCYSTGVVC